jgi:hypothetical protein
MAQATVVKITDEIVHAACAAQDGPRWREFNASLEWPIRAGLEAALKVAEAAATSAPAERHERDA